MASRSDAPSPSAPGGRAPKALSSGHALESSGTERLARLRGVRRSVTTPRIGQKTPSYRILEERARALPSRRDSLEEVVLTRVRRALEQLVGTVGERELQRAAEQPTDLSVLSAALGSASAPLSEIDPRLLQARLRGLELKAQLLAAEGGCVSSGVLAKKLGITRQALDKRRRTGQLFAVRTEDTQDWRYPLWQFADGRMLSGFLTVLETLRAQGHDDWSIMTFWLEGELDAAGTSALEALRQGRVEDVLRAARLYGEQGAR